MERSIVAFSSKEDSQEAFNEITEKIDSVGISPIAIIFFSDCDRFWFFSKYLHEKYTEAASIGSTTYVNFSSDNNSNNSSNDSLSSKYGVTALAIFSGIEVSFGCLFEINRHPKNYKFHITQALNALTSYENTCCLEFSTAFSMGEELILDTFNELLEPLSIPVVGASAGNLGVELEGTKTLVALNGDMYKNTCVFIFIHNLNGKIVTYRENIFIPSGINFIATDVDCEERTVYEYDNVPALQAMSNALGVDLINIESELRNHPMGRILGNDLFISEFNKINDDGSIQYYSRIYNRTKVTILNMDENIEKIWDETKNYIHKKCEKISFSIVINCYSRTKLFQQKKLFEKFCDKLNKNYGNFIGMSGYGEQLNNFHFNQTMVLLCFE